MKQYAILTLHDLKIRKFDHKDDVKTACASLGLPIARYQVLRWNEQAKMYCSVDVFCSSW